MEDSRYDVDMCERGARGFVVDGESGEAVMLWYRVVGGEDKGCLKRERERERTCCGPRVSSIQRNNMIPHQR